MAVRAVRRLNCGDCVIDRNNVVFPAPQMPSRIKPDRFQFSLITPHANPWPGHTQADSGRRTADSANHTDIEKIKNFQAPIRVISVIRG